MTTAILNQTFTGNIEASALSFDGRRHTAHLGLRGPISGAQVFAMLKKLTINALDLRTLEITEAE